MDKIIIFAIFSIVIVLVSRRTLLNNKTHGFYRFISWESIAWLLSVWDEKECKAFFGEKYVDYMKRTKRFIPFIF